MLIRNFINVATNLFMMLRVVFLVDEILVSDIHVPRIIVIYSNTTVVCKVGISALFLETELVDFEGLR